MAEGARLESVYTGNRIVGSNPTLSAMLENLKLLVCPALKLKSQVYRDSDAGAESGDLASRAASTFSGVNGSAVRLAPVAS